MIPFFRKIRNPPAGEAGKMADDNRPLKYIRYAVGEIVLVVIGILIALQINTWNEERKDTKTETRSLFNLKSEFDHNQKLLQSIIDIKQENIDQSRTYIELITNDTFPLTHKIALKIPTNFAVPWGATNSVLNSLLSTGAINKIKNDTLKFLLTNWSVGVNNYKSSEIRYTNAVDQKQEYLDKRIFNPIVKDGNYSEIWPGNYLPNNISEKQDSLRATFINDVEFYNLIRNTINKTYIQLMNAKLLDNDYKKISKLIEQELEDRNFKMD